MNTDTASQLTWAEIDLRALEHNVKAFKKLIGKDREVIAVVKANAYGHGAVPVARAALRAGATRLAVHRLEEGIELREAGIEMPILVMGYSLLYAVSLMCTYRLTPTVTTLEYARALDSCWSANADEAGTGDRRTGTGHDDTACRPFPIHVKIDSGMNRHGVYPEQVLEFVRGLSGLPGISLEGIYTHFATADEADITYLKKQQKTFSEVLTAFKEKGFEFDVVHACNSAATMRVPEDSYTAVRIGLSMYGMVPSAEWDPPIELQPVLSLKSRVVRLATIPPGSSIGYGRTYTTEKETRIALVPVGYGDGYHRLISNRGEVLIKGQRAPIRGRVSMDQIVVDVSDISGIHIEDTVTLIGKDGKDRISAEEAARWANTINYEVTTALLPRVVRVYIEN